MAKAWRWGTDPDRVTLTMSAEEAQALVDWLAWGTASSAVIHGDTHRRRVHGRAILRALGHGMRRTWTEEPERFQPSDDVDIEEP